MTSDGRKSQRVSQERRYRHPFLLLGWVILSLIGTVSASADSPDKSRAGPMHFLLHSKEPYQAVHVPFLLQDGDIIFQAILAGKTMECDLDTGTNNPTWADTPAIPGRKTGTGGIGIDGAGKRTGGQIVILPAIRIGGYELREVAGFAVATGSGSGKGMDYLKHTALLGTSVLSPVVVTIDYQKQELILRRPEYDFSRQPRGEHDLVFDLAPKSLSDNGRLILRGTMGKQPIRIALDTGWNAREIGLTAAFRDKIRAALEADNPAAKSVTVRKEMLGGEAQLERLPQVAFSLGDKQPLLFKRPAIVMPGQYTDMDAVIGSDVLQYFRVTIDYRRKKLLLQPFLPECADYINPDPSRDELIIKGTSYWIPDGTAVTVRKNGSIAIKPPKPLPAPSAAKSSGSSWRQ